MTPPGSVLTLDAEHETRYASWNVTLHKMLRDSGRFTVRYDSVPRVPRRLAGKVTGNLSTFYVNDQLLVLDTWDTDSPTTNCWREGLFRSGGLLGNAALVLKIQHEPKDLWDRFTADTGIPVTAWTMFPSREFPLEWFRWREDTAHLYLGTLTGARRYGRGAYLDAAKGLSVYTKTEGQKDPIADFLMVVERCRWGISLKGKKGHDGKNRREVEYASCGMPLALNYTPHYPFPFRAGEHFFHLTKPADLKLLAEVDPRPFAAASLKLWRERFSPQGAADTLTDLLRKTQHGLGRTDQTAA